MSLLSACLSSTPPTPTPEAVERAVQTLEELGLIGTSWQAISFGGPELDQTVPVIPDTRLTVNFGIDRYAGTGGCNFFLGVYEVEGETMRFMTPAQTMAQCTPEAIMEQEGMFLSSLWNIIEYRKDGDKLMGYTTDDQLLVTFEPAAPVEFEGTVWSMRFQDYGNGLTPLLTGSEVTALFEGGNLSGSAGCNTYTTTYTLDGDNFEAAEVVSTRMACEEPEGIMDQEAKFLENIQNAVKLIQTGGLIQLLDAEGNTIVAFGVQ
jgi:heat shock protein HslJ